MLEDGYSYILPVGLLDYFDILQVEDSKTQIKIYLEEKSNLGDPLYESKGFYEHVLINDFPVRGKALLLDLRRRRWVNKETGAYFNRDFKLVADGIRITQEFASFLKGLHR